MGKNSMKRIDILNPIWYNQEKTHIIAEFLYDNNQKVTASITNPDPSQPNPDWKEILQKFSIEEIDNNTNNFNDEKRKQYEEKSKINQDLNDRRKQEILFNTKAELFDLDVIRDSTNKPQKAKIRKAKSISEALMNASIIFVEEYLKQKNEEQK